MTKVDLILIGQAPEALPTWALGEVHRGGALPQEVSTVVTSLDLTADGYLFWDASSALPGADLILSIFARPGNAWHAGLKLRTESLPHTSQYTFPTWMLNLNAPGDIESTSWRLSLRALLVQSDVLREMGGPLPHFETLTAAGLEMGCRWIQNGVLLRHTPELLPVGAKPEPNALPYRDELRFVFALFRDWRRPWTAWRSVMTGFAGIGTVLEAWGTVKRETAAVTVPGGTFPHAPGATAKAPDANPRVTILIPTIDRYPYLKKLLEQLREQTVPPHEIIVIDQTEHERRDTTVAEPFGDLPLMMIYQDEPGQCSSRNAGLQVATGDYVLFVDDDDEVEPDLIQQHIDNMARFGVTVSSGVADETGAVLPENFKYIRASDVFPTNNTLIEREVLERSGLFDLAYNRGARADGDLGMRVYQSGTMMLLNPEISVFHHHAPRGGLREHKARKITYASSRQTLWQRHIPSVTEIYLMRRYFTPEQVREALRIRVFSTFSSHGNRTTKILRLFTALVALPDTLLKLRANYQRATEMLAQYPQIPSYDASVPVGTAQ